MSERRFGLGTARVSGPSMVPTLHSGDVVLVRYGSVPRPGQVVLARYRSMPDRLVVKRVVKRVVRQVVIEPGRPAPGATAGDASGDWWLASDNFYAGGGSDVHGAAEVLGRVVVRLRPGLPRRVR